MTVWRNLSLTPTARALATSYAREVNIHCIDLLPLLLTTCYWQVRQRQSLCGSLVDNRLLLTGVSLRVQAPAGKLTGCEDNVAHLV